MKANTITIKQSIFIGKPKEVVWDFTQDYNNRTNWDKSVLKATVLQTSPERMVKLEAAGNTTMTFIYKLDDRPNKTSLALKEVKSLIIKTGGGGSWTYKDQDGGTLWNQTNTIALKNYVLLPILIGFYKWLFTVQTKRAMKRAKKMIESTQ